MSWCIYILVHIYLDQTRYKNITTYPVYHYTVFFLFAMAAVYVCAFYIYPVCLKSNRSLLLLFPTLVIFCLLFGLLKDIFHTTLLHRVVGIPLPDRSAFFADSIVLFGVYALVGLVMFAFRREKERIRLQENILRLQVEKAESEAAQARLQARNMEAELAMLKAQFNPHLLYNTLNYFYGKIFKLDETLASQLVKLSDILRYSLEGQPDTKVPLQDEINYLHNFLELHKLRFGPTAHIDFQIKGSTRGHQILPLVLISFVENAFKHGDYSQPAYPIRIQLTATDTQIFFRVQNRKRQYLTTGPQVVSTGLGLDNVRRRLELICPNEYELKIDNGPELYTVEITLKSVRPAVPSSAAIAYF